MIWSMPTMRVPFCRVLPFLPAISVHAGRESRHLFFGDIARGLPGGNAHLSGAFLNKCPLLSAAAAAQGRSR